MARRSLNIPDEVKTKIRQHLSDSYIRALEGYHSANEEEDTLTGDLGASLRIKNQKVFVENNNERKPGTWIWSINYTKFRGRGIGATESLLGADGIFEMSLQDGEYIQKKSLLFQSKLNWHSDANLISQAIKLTTWREAAFVLNYTADKFEAIGLDAIVSSKGKRKNLEQVKALDEFLGNDFLNCLIGDVELKYDAASRRLIWRSIAREKVATKFSIPHRIAIKIRAPMRSITDEISFEREISHDEIYKNRMYASEEDILSLDSGATLRELRKARSEMALIYHSDRITFADDLLNELIKMRMQEINLAHDTLKDLKSRNVR